MTSEWVSIPVDGQDMHVYRAQPETAGQVPGVLVIVEAFGVHKHLQEVSDKLAREGHVAAAPVLYHRLGTNPLFGYTGEGTGPRTKATAGLRDAELVRDLDATSACPHGHAQVQADRLGVGGVRMAYLAAGSCPGLSAVVSYGGRIPLTLGERPSPFHRAPNMQCLVLGNFGARDWNPTPDEVRRIGSELNTRGKVCDIKIYPGADHGFNRDERPSYHDEASQDAWGRTLGRFQRYLKA